MINQFGTPDSWVTSSPEEAPLLVILGGPNDAAGNLSDVARTRVATAFDAHMAAPKLSILPTGGFGEHFNTSSQPHHVHLTTALTGTGINPNLILPGVPSTNTAEDASQVCNRARDLGYVRLVVITSDFHRERTALLFDQVSLEISVDFRLASSSQLDRELVNALREHERSALKRLRAQINDIF